MKKKTLNTVREYYTTDPCDITTQLELIVAKNEQEIGTEEKEQVVSLCTHLIFHLIKAHMRIIERREWKTIIEFVWGMLRGMNKETCVIDCKWGLYINKNVGFTGITSKS